MEDEEKKEVVRGLRKGGLTLAEIASEISMSISWVYSVVNEKYSSVGIVEKKTLSRDDIIKDKAKKIREKIRLKKEERDRISKEVPDDIGYSPYRTIEDLIEYRRKRDAVINNPD